MSFSRAGKAATYLLRALPIPVAVVLSAFLVVGASEASFSGTTSNDDSRFQAGIVSIGDSAKNSIEGDVLFHDRHITPGYSESRCVTVVSKSDVDVRVKMYGVDVSVTPVADAMTVSIERGHVHHDNLGDTSCTGFHDGRELYEGSLSDFGRNTRDYRHGLSHDPAGDPLQRESVDTYRITLNLPESTGNSVAGGKAGATFAWEAQS